ncbi:aminodeoxychorismate lyase [Agarivorans aestuarii]|uniref:aminodeoxychorismate lyase n=1 Tax=Agarivorans aestuarii TaxID=1563703 RepID=UPI001C7F6CE7|nr:aminodeoxychorismate lyase [Agarivorans aestuarii]
MSDASLSKFDRGLNYGDGFFTTMLVQSGEVKLWDYHQQRLQGAQQQLAFPHLDFVQIKQQADRLASDKNHAVLKIVVTRGEGGRGYGLPELVQPNILMTLSDFPESYLSLRDKGITLGIAKQRLASGSAFSTIKTLNRLEQVQLKREADLAELSDLVCCDIFDRVVEGVASNLFWVKDKVIYTSDLDGAGVAGVQRQFLLDNVKHSPYQIQLGKFKIEDVVAADEIFVSNSVLQFAPVNTFNERNYERFPVCRWFQNLVKNAS